jgi:hypothetical protein
LLLLEEQEGSVNFKFGVLYTRPGQNSDDEMFSNGGYSYRLYKLQIRRIEHLLKLFVTINILSFVCKCKAVPQVAGSTLQKDFSFCITNLASCAPQYKLHSHRVVGIVLISNSMEQSSFEKLVSLS